ncbi:MAG: GntR family transcriptional regulator [Desulfobacteraceae bacterium]|nr:MAG: GntR family transcriptional regulator [Desulfobacteraceae bacterium]
MDQLSKNNLSDQIVDLISKKIIRQELKPGEAIVETQISKELGVSRSPVRDALHILEQIWLVERTPKGGYQVSMLTMENIQYLFETAVVLYQFAFSKAAEKVDPTDYPALESLMLRMEASIEGNDFELYITSVTQMAHKILEIAGNPMIERIARELMPTAERIQWASITMLPDQLKKVVSHVRRGVESIYKKQPDEAASAFGDFAAAHIEVVIESLNQSSEQTATN